VAKAMNDHSRNSRVLLANVSRHDDPAEGHADYGEGHHVVAEGRV
jgi:hypothetical protein